MGVCHSVFALCERAQQSCDFGRELVHTASSDPLSSSPFLRRLNISPTCTQEPVESCVEPTDRVLLAVARYSRLVTRLSAGENAELYLLSKGSGDVLASDFVASSQMRDVLEAMRAEFDLIVIDTAPFTRVPYAGELVRHADGAIVVVPSGGNVGPVEEVAERLAVLGVEPTGYVYNGVPYTVEKGRSEGSLRNRVGT